MPSLTHLIFLSVLSALTSASNLKPRVSANTLFAPNPLSLLRRQTTTCEGYGTCAEACGAGYTTCVVANRCYNPAAGQQCCSDSTYCDPGTYCTNLGCCPNGSSLSDCGAASSLSVIPPPASSPSASPSNPSAITSSASTTSASASTASTTASAPPSSSIAATASSSTSSKSNSRSSSTTPLSTSPPSPWNPVPTATTTSASLRTSAASTSSALAQVTGNAASGRHRASRVEVAAAGAALAMVVGMVGGVV